MKRKAFASPIFYFFDIAIARFLKDMPVPQENTTEVKASKNITEKHLKGLKALKEEGISKQFIVVCREEHSRSMYGILVLPWRYFFDQLWKDAFKMSENR